MSQYNLDKIFNPKAVAVIGATDTYLTAGRAVMTNLIDGKFKGPIFPIHPHKTEILGIKAYTSLEDVHEPIDLAVICTAIKVVPDIIEDCIRHEIGGAVILSAGGKETGSEGAALEERIKELTRNSGLRLIGPNCIGITSASSNLNASFMRSMPRPGNLAFIAQSGAICSIILDYAAQENIGFSHFISIGSTIDVDFGDLIDYLGNDVNVSSILLYIEGLTRQRKFMSAARAVSRIKPIIVLKSGRSSAGARAAQSHTGSMAGEDAFYEAAFKRAGIVRVNILEDLFGCAELLSKQKPPQGPNLAIITLAGGLGVMAADYLSDYGLEPVKLEPETMDRLNQILPPFWSHDNPVDITGAANLQGFQGSIDICSEADEIDAVLVIYTPSGLFSSEDFAQCVAEVMAKRKSPVFAVMPGGLDIEKGRHYLNEKGIPTFPTPEGAIRAFWFLYTYHRNLTMLQEVPRELSSPMQIKTSEAGALIQDVMDEGRLLMTEYESKMLLNAYGIPTNQTRLAYTIDRAVIEARRLDYPVVAKINSQTISHKSDAGGIKLDLRNADEVIDAYLDIESSVRAYDSKAHFGGVTIQQMIKGKGYEVILGSKQDDSFGPILLFGMGGIMTEIIKDRAVGLPPLNRLLARRMIEETKVYHLLKGYRGQAPANLELLEEIMVRLSQLVTDFPEISELDINPLFLVDDRAYALDARVVLKSSEKRAPLHLVISPYPTHFENEVRSKSGHPFFIRPIRPEDAPLLVDLVEGLSERSLFQRFKGDLEGIEPDIIARLTQIDYDRGLALVALDQAVDKKYMVGVARYLGDPDGREAEASIVVRDEWQGRSIGAMLFEQMLRAAKLQGYEKIWGYALRENQGMIELAERTGARIIPGENPKQVKLLVDLKSWK